MCVRGRYVGNQIKQPDLLLALETLIDPLLPGWRIRSVLTEEELDVPTVVTDEYLEGRPSCWIQPKIFSVRIVLVHKWLILSETTDPARADKISHWICAKS